MVGVVVLLRWWWGKQHEKQREFLSFCLKESGDFVNSSSSIGIVESVELVICEEKGAEYCIGLQFDLFLWGFIFTIFPFPNLYPLISEIQ